MDKASASGAGDSRFESWADHRQLQRELCTAEDIICDAQRLEAGSAQWRLRSELDHTQLQRELCTAEDIICDAQRLEAGSA